MGIVVVAVVVWLAAWALTPRVARSKGRQPGAWTLAVILVGPVPLLVLSALPRRGRDVMSPA